LVESNVIACERNYCPVVVASAWWDIALQENKQSMSPCVGLVFVSTSLFGNYVRAFF
jgi:hypothetical protein